MKGAASLRSVFFERIIGNLTESKELLLVWSKFSNFIGGGLVVMGAGRNISFLLQLIFVVLKYTEEEMNDLETVLFMLSCGALETSNIIYLE